MLTPICFPAGSMISANCVGTPNFPRYFHLKSASNRIQMKRGAKNTNKTLEIPSPISCFLSGLLVFNTIPLRERCIISPRNIHSISLVFLLYFFSGTKKKQGTKKTLFRILLFFFLSSVSLAIKKLKRSQLQPHPTSSEVSPQFLPLNCKHPDFHCRSCSCCCHSDCASGTGCSNLPASPDPG